MYDCYGKSIFRMNEICEEKLMNPGAFMQSGSYELYTFEKSCPSGLVDLSRNGKPNGWCENNTLEL